MRLQKWREPHPLDGVHNKLNRAKKHLETVDGYLLKYKAFNPHRMIRNLNAEGTFYEYVFSSLFPPFIEFGLVIAEYVYHLRSALDQLVFGLAEFSPDLSDGEWEKAQRSTSFPISEKDQGGAINGRLMYVPESIRADVHAAIHSVQPFSTSERPAHQVLAILERLSNGDKHRSPQVTGNILKIDTANLPLGVEIIAVGDVKDGEALARVAAHLDPVTEFEPRVTFEVRVGVPDRVPRSILVMDLPQIYYFIRDEVVPKFEKFFPLFPNRSSPTSRSSASESPLATSTTKGQSPPANAPAAKHENSSSISSITRGPDRRALYAT